VIRRVAVAVLALALAAPALALSQGPASAVGIQATLVGSDPAFGGMGATVVKALDRQLRLTGAATVGRAGPEMRGRGELALEYLFDPATRGWSPRLAGGVAGVSGSRGGGYALLMVGLEQRPRERTGWRIDLGVGGGVRVAASFTWRLGRH
jgi:hypothetical protein